MRKFRRVICSAATFCILIGWLAGIAPIAFAASAMTASENCVNFIKQVEGFSAQPYYDYQQYTVGYGTKCPSEKYFEYSANGIPRAEADALLRQAVAEIVETINKKLIDKYSLTLNQHQFDALVSFSYNIGTGWMTYDSTLRNAILRNAGDDDLVYAFGLYCTAGGKYLPGLITRRLCEANIYLNGIYDHHVSDAYGYVYYDANGGTLTYRVQGFICDNGTVPAADAVRSGDAFIGWYTNVTGGTQVHVLDSSLSGRTLFARWLSTENPDYQNTSLPTVIVTGDVVNVRSGPGTNYSIVRQAYRNDSVQISHVTHITNMRWGQIRDGWICLDYTNYDALFSETNLPSSGNNATPPDNTTVPENSPAPNAPDGNISPEPLIPVSGTVKVNDALRVRSGPGTHYSVAGYLYNGDEVEILEQQTTNAVLWGRIATGWVSMDYIITDALSEGGTNGPEQLPAQPQIPDSEQSTQPKDVPEQIPQQKPAGSTENTETKSVYGKIKADALRIRSGPGTKNPIVGFYYQNDPVVILDQFMVGSVCWGNTDKGWINMDYVVTGSAAEAPAQPVDGKVMTVIADCLRVRKGTGTDYRISQLLYYGDTVTVYEIVSVDGMDWGRVPNGWVRMDYVK